MIFLYPLLFLLGILIAYLVLSLMAGRPLFISRKDAGSRERGGAGDEAENASLKTCPICGTLLDKG
ncbi:MAG: hypothetical protein LBT68_03085, partial [Spirochaetales bacterium]|nr:hypothetical protein [Spirochaetales bacterium]